MEEDKQPANLESANSVDDRSDTENGQEASDELEQLTRLAAERDDFRDKFMRAMADLENYRRRVEKEKADLLNYGLENFLRELLPVLDSFDKAIEDRKDGDKESFIEGVQMVQRQFLTVLEKSGLTQITANGEKFDPNLHQAIQRIEKEGLEDEIVDQEFARGYLLNGRLLRPSMVTVAVPKS